mgnify:CR=1 FL=1
MSVYNTVQAGANILFDGTSGTANELIFQTFTVAGGIAEAFRVQQGGAKVTGSLDIDGGISIKDNLITASRSNDNLQLDATGTGAIEMGASHVSPPWWNATTNSCYNSPDRWNATTLEGWSLHMVGSGSKRDHFVLSGGERGFFFFVQFIHITVVLTTEVASITGATY